MLYVHVGYHRTGTTYLQTNVFPKLSIQYLGKRYDKSWNDGPIRKLLKHQPPPNLLQKTLSNVDNDALISHEVLCRDFKTSLPNIKRIVPESSIILTIRRQDTLTCSRFRHDALMVSHGAKPVCSIEKCVESYNFYQVVKMIDSLFDHFLILRYELLFKDKGEQDNLFNFLGVEPQYELFNKPKLNKSKITVSKRFKWALDKHKSSNRKLAEEFNLDLKRLGYY